MVPRASRLVLLGAFSLVVCLSPSMVSAANQERAKVALHLKTLPTKPGGWCTIWAPTTVPCSQFVTQGELGQGYLAYLVVAGANDTADVSGVSCGISYDPVVGQGVDVYSWQLCADGLEFRNSGDNGEWPASGGGNRITWLTCQGRVVPPDGVHAIAGVFYLYAYSEDRLAATENRNLQTGPELVVGACGGVESRLPASAAGYLAFSEGAAAPGGNPCTGFPEATCSITPPRLNFPDVPVGGSALQSFRIENLSAAGSPSLTGDVELSCPSFSITAGAGDFSLGPGEARTVSVLFQPTALGPTQCSVLLGTSCEAVPLVGVGIPPNPPVCSVQPTSLVFGQVPQGAYKDLEFTITNVGVFPSSDLLGSVGELCGPFRVVAGAGPFRIPRGTSISVTVRFSPVDLGYQTCGIPLGLPCGSFSVSGSGVLPPDAALSPLALSERLVVGEAISRTLLLKNTGVTDLIWRIDLRGTPRVLSTYVLSPPDPAATTMDSPEAAGAVASGEPRPEPRSTAIQAVLADLAGVRILWDRIHGEELVSSHSALVADLVLRGADVREGILPITPERLQDVDILWIGNLSGSWTQAEVRAVVDWVRDGGALLLDADRSVDAMNGILFQLEAGITFSSVHGRDGVTGRFLSHETTRLLDRIDFLYPLGSLEPPVAPGQPLVEDSSHRPMAACASLGSGRVFAAAGDLCHDSHIGYADNQVFVNQVFDWLAGPLHISAWPSSGFVQPGASTPLTIRFSAEREGSFDSEIVVESNDPDEREIVVSTHHEVSGTPEIGIRGPESIFSSVVPFEGYRASTAHRLVVEREVGGEGWLSVTLEGDFRNATASVSIEGNSLGSFGNASGYCSSTSRTFTLSAPLLAEVLADGEVQVTVTNSSGVGPYSCSTNRHTVDLRITDRADSLRFGRIALGQSRERRIVVVNSGTGALRVEPSLIGGPDVGMDPTPAVLMAGQSREFAVRFSPSVIGNAQAMLRILSNDPDEAVIEVPVLGEGYEAPRAAVAPEAVQEALFSGQEMTRTITLSNWGGTDLHWVSRTVGTAPGTPSVPNSAPGGESSTSANPGIKMSAGLEDGDVQESDSADLAGVTILWDRAHGQSGSGGVDLFTELAARGVAVIQNGEATTDALLVGVDIYWSSRAWYFWSPAEIEALGRWVHAGGALLLEGDSAEEFGPILETLECGFYYTQDPGTEGSTTSIAAHPATLGVERLYLGPSYSSLSETVHPGRLLVRDTSGQPQIAVAEIGNGRLAVLTDGLFAGWIYGWEQNREFSRLLVDWLAEASFFTVEPASGVIPAGGSTDIILHLDAGTREPRSLTGELLVESDDVFRPTVHIPVELDVMAGPFAHPVPEALDFGTVYVGSERSLEVTIENLGSRDLIVGAPGIENPAFMTGGSGFLLTPWTLRQFIVTYRPNAEGPDSGTLTLPLNNPGLEALVLELHGEGLRPPIAGVSPAALSDSLLSNRQSAQSLELSNRGASDLEWVIGLTAVESSYALTAPDSSSALPPEGVSIPLGATPPRTAPIVASLADLRGARIFWDRSHGQSPPTLWSTLFSDVRLRGATVEENSATLTPQLLTACHVLWVTRGSVGWSAAEVAAVTEWIRSGGSLLLEGGTSPDSSNAILVALDAGLTFGISPGEYGPTNRILPHLTTRGVEGIYLAGPTQLLVTPHSPAGALVNDVQDHPVAGFANPDAGRVVVTTGQPFIDYNIYREDNELFGNRILDWLAGPRFVSASPRIGVLASGEEVSIEVGFDATGRSAGEYPAVLTVDSNDPASPSIPVPITLYVADAPCLSLSPNPLDFGPALLGTTRSLPLEIQNRGSGDLVVAGAASGPGPFEWEGINLVIPPGEARMIHVSFSPASPGSVTGELPLTSNDPDGSLVVASLRGEGEPAPQMAVPTAEITAALYSGQHAEPTLTVENNGQGPLHWWVRAEGTEYASFQLTDPETAAVPQPDETTLPLPSEDPRAEPIRADLLVLNGTHVFWTRGHGQYPSTGWSTVLSDLRNRGAIVTESSAPITPEVLGGFDLLWTTDVSTAWTPQEVAAIRDWVQSGGALLVESDDATGRHNQLLSGVGTGIGYGTPAARSGYTTAITSHAATRDVIRAYFPSPGVHLPTLLPPATALVHDSQGRPVAAANAVGGGRVVVIADEVFQNGAVALGDNQRLGNQLVDWLTGPGFVRLNPTTGVLPPATTTSIQVRVDASGLAGGVHTAELAVSGDDPSQPLMSVPVTIAVTPAPDAGLGAASLDFGSLLVGAAGTLNLSVVNAGALPLHILGAGVDHKDCVATALNPEISPGGEGMIQVSFHPTAPGPLEATLEVQTDDPDEGLLRVGIQGTSLPAPRLSFSMESLAFPMYPGDQTSGKISITNAGAGDLIFAVGLEPNPGNPVGGDAGATGPGVPTTLPGAPLVTVDVDSGTVSPGSTRDLVLSVDARAAAPGEYAWTLTLASNDPIQSPASLAVEASVISAPRVRAMGPGIEFGEIYVGGSVNRALNVVNCGTESTPVSGSFDTPGYEVQPGEFTLAPNETVSVTVTFHPEGPGRADGRLRLTSNDPESPAVTLLSGSAVQAPVLEVSPPDIEAPILPGRVRTSPITVCNRGGSPLVYRLEPLPDHASEPDAFGHVWMAGVGGGVPDFAWVDVSAVGVPVFAPGVDDENAGPFPIGFLFPFYGAEYTEFRICSNGWISFTDPRAGFAPQALPSSSPGVPGNLLAVYWNDWVLDPAAGSNVYVHTDGSRLVVQFENLIRFGSSAAQAASFEVVLYPDGSILYQYRTMAAAAAGGTLGIQNADGSDGFHIDPAALPARDDLAILITRAADWLHVPAGDHLLEAGQCEATDILLDAGGLGAGDREGALYLQSNDPSRPHAIEEVVMHVGGVPSVDTDISPHSLNSASQGRWIRVSVELPSGYRAEDVRLESVRAQETVPAESSLLDSGDFNQNGVPDLTFTFDRGPVIRALPEGDDVEVVVTGDIGSRAVFVAGVPLAMARPRLLTPNGGETLLAGSFQELRWDAPTSWGIERTELFYSIDDGASWVGMPEPAGDTPLVWRVPDEPTERALLRVELFDQYGFLGEDHSDSSFAVSRSVTGVEEAIPAVFALYPSFPNPFAVRTAIRFDLPSESIVSLRIHDIQGRVVTTLVDARLPAGRHQSFWSGRDDAGRQVASGVYVYRLTTGRHEAAKELLLLR